MASTCISSSVDDARVPVRATYVKLYKWPESDREFVRSMRSKAQPRKDGHPTVMDSFSCRQLYLRSYAFSREEDTPDEKTVKCFRRTWKMAADGGRRKCKGTKRGKGFRCSVFASIFRRLLSCGTKIDVVN